VICSVYWQDSKCRRSGWCTRGSAGLNIEREAITALNATHLLCQSIAVFQHNPPTLSCFRPILTRVSNTHFNKNGAIVFLFPHYCKIDDVRRLAAAIQTAWRTVQKFPVTHLQQLLCLTCAVCGCTVMLQDRAPRHRSFAGAAEETHGRSPSAQ
jgi:hypothetical protein